MGGLGTVGRLGVLCVMLGVLGLRAPGQEAAPPRAPAAGERGRALELMRDLRYLEAVPLLERLAAHDPSDREVAENLAIALVTQAAVQPADEASQTLIRARSILVRLEQGGPLTPLGQVLREKIPADGRNPRQFRDTAGMAALREGEAAFARRQFGKAREAYARALALEPGRYDATLFLGDTYFAEQEYGRAATWFARAAAIDPDQAVAHRYWGDALLHQGKIAEARDRFLDGIIAEPYARAPWLSLQQWADRAGVRLRRPEVPHAGEDAGAGKAYLDRAREVRVTWRRTKYLATHPGEKAYRRSLGEEAEALHAVAAAVRAGFAGEKLAEAPPALKTLVALDDAGLIEAALLLSRPDDDLARDYEAYRAAHRDALRRYLAEYVAPLPDAGRDREER